MFPPEGRHRKRRVANLALCALGLLSGCALSVFLHVTSVSVDDQLKVLLGGGGNSTVLLHGREAFVTDVKMGDYSLHLRREVEEELGRKVERILLTHAHGDHARGLWAFPDVPVVMVHPNAKARLEAEGQHANWVEVEREVRVRLGSEEVRVLYLGVGHTDGDLVAFMPARKLLVSGDLFSTGYVPHVDEAYGGDVAQLVDTLDRLLALDFERVVPGHGELAPRAEVQAVADRLHALKAAVAAAVAAGKTEAQTVAEVPWKALQGELKEIPFSADGEKNVHMMWRALQRSATLAGAHE